MLTVNQRLGQLDALARQLTNHADNACPTCGRSGGEEEFKEPTGEAPQELFDAADQRADAHVGLHRCSTCGRWQWLIVEVEEITVEQGPDGELVEKR
jgi:hypothetical protein